jgi:hypothetical protein
VTERIFCGIIICGIEDFMWQMHDITCSMGYAYVNRIMGPHINLSTGVGPHTHMRHMRPHFISLTKRKKKIESSIM